MGPVQHELDFLALKIRLGRIAMIRARDTFVGPFTFGDVAYQLLNQTLVYLTLHDVEGAP